MYDRFKNKMKENKSDIFIELCNFEILGWKLLMIENVVLDGSL